MSQKKWKLKRILLLSVVILVVGGFFVNWLLTYRLQDFLREQMSQKVSEATDGFYTLTFDKLTVGLFNGELKIEGLDIRPDSAIFEKLSATDSLPDVYFKIHINSIDFKGLNLTWRINYRKLHFDLFEISTPVVELISPYPLKDSEPDDDNETVTEKEENLYKMVSPYFDVVSVKYLNLQNATVSYTVADDIIPSVYGLRDVSFHASGFRLDENSSKDGKLLYCDNFDFTTNVSQKLLQNNQMVLNTDKIRLSTQDSIIKIEGIELLPQKQIWEINKHTPPSFVDARIKDVEVNGLVFRREDAINYLTAHSFNITSSDIEYYKIDTIIQPDVKSAKKDTVLGAWSLYSILSPVFRSTAIERISVEETKFKYTEVSDKGTDEYTLNNFDFWANNFLVNSQSKFSPSLLYSSDFGFVADNLTGDMESRNHRMNIDKISLNTEEGTFRVKGVKVEPIETRGQYDYMQGTIDSISLTGLKTENGLDAGRLLIKSPDINYTRNPYFKKIKLHSTQLENQKEDIEIDIDHTDKVTSIDMVASITKHYYVKSIEMEDADFTYKYMRKGAVDIFRINNFSFFARDFLVDDYTRKNIDWYFTCSDLGFNLKQFDNYIMDRQYRLSAKDIILTGLGGNLRFRDVKLIPQSETWEYAPGQYMEFTSPLIEAIGVNPKDKIFKVGLLRIETPEVFLTKDHATPKPKLKKVSGKPMEFSNIVNTIVLGEIDVNNAKVRFADKTQGSNMKSTFDLSVRNIIWDITKEKSVAVNEIMLDAPIVDYETSDVNDVSKVHTIGQKQKESFLEKIKVKVFAVKDAQVNLNTPDNKSSIGLESFKFNGLDWKLSGDDSYFKISDIDLVNPLAKMFIYARNNDTLTVKQGNTKDIYTVLGNFSKNISVGNVDVKNANVDYHYINTGVKSIEQKLNKVYLSLKGLVADNSKRDIKLDDISFSTENLSFPIDNGFYTVTIGDVSLLKQGEKLELNNIKMKSLYPQMEFAYRHPNHKDWFDVSVGNFTAKGIDIPRFFTDNVLKIDDVQVSDVDLKNFKNQQIATPRRLSPMIYEKIQKAPVKFSVGNMDVINFAVTYEELSKKGETPGKIFFTEMNGHFSGFTNIVNEPEQYIKLDADGKLMDEGYFTATWKIPVDPYNDRFILRANLHNFDLQELNQLIQPLANANVTNGVAENTQFNMDASSVGAHISMSFLYSGLRVNVMKEKNGELGSNKFITGLANAVIRRNNPKNPKSKPRSVDIYVERDPYHSTFNYFWQILQPALVESVGVPQRTLNFVKDIPKIPEKLKNFFWKKEDFPLEEKPDKN